MTDELRISSTIRNGETILTNKAVAQFKTLFE